MVPPDTYSTTIKILDENENVLASTSINRTNDAYQFNYLHIYRYITHNDTVPENETEWKV